MAAALNTAAGTMAATVGEIAASADAVAASSEELSASSAQISASAEETSAQSGVVSGAAEEVSRSVQTVAAGAEQMGASIREIASNAAEASEVAARAVTAAETTTATVAKLGESSAEIGNVVKVITSHRRADQPAGAERHDRGGAGRRGRQGLRGRRQRGQGAGAGDGEGDRGHRPPGAGDPGRHHRGGGRDRGDLARSSRQISDRQTTIASRGGGADRDDQRDVALGAGGGRAGTTEIAANITGVSTAAESTTQALAPDPHRGRRAVPDGRRPAHHGRAGSPTEPHRSARATGWRPDTGRHPVSSHSAECRTDRHVDNGRTVTDQSSARRATSRHARPNVVARFSGPTLLRCPTPSTQSLTRAHGGRRARRTLPPSAARPRSARHVRSPSRPPARPRRRAWWGDRGVRTKTLTAVGAAAVVAAGVGVLGIVRPAATVGGDQPGLYAGNVAGIAADRGHAERR